MEKEDAHLCNPNFEQGLGLFGVFDGHGGIEVAKFVAEHIEEVLKSSKSFKLRNYEQSLQDAFLKLDEMLQTPAGKKEL